MQNINEPTQTYRQNTAWFEVLFQAICAEQPKIFAISGAQGSGKSTLAASLQRALQQVGVRCGVVSLDDYYFSKDARARLAARVHPLLQKRGVPGTHHISRLQQDIANHLAGKVLTLPRFDKAQDDTLADEPAARYDMLIVEGWCLGALPQQATQLAMPVNQLDLVAGANTWLQYQNDQLRNHYLPLWGLLQPMVYLKPPDWSTVCQWRLQQEQQLWQLRGQGMDAATLQDFMLPFQRWTEAMLGGDLAGCPLQLQLDQRRQICTPIPAHLWGKSQN